MKSIFNSNMIITQFFGVDFEYPSGSGKKYYKNNYNMNGHNGIDVIPDNEDWRVYNIFSGQVIYAGVHESYGKRVGIWNKQKNICEWFNHLEKIEVNLNEYISEDICIGLMGNSGQSMGAHVHYQISKVDENCNRVEYNNGFFGYTDPLPYLE